MIMLSFLLLASAASTKSLCPSQISDKQAVIDNLSGYEVSYAKGNRSLFSVDAYIGHPSGFLEQYPEKMTRSNVDWIFSGKKDIWVECRYENSAVIIRRNVGPVAACHFKKKLSVRDSAFLQCI